MIKLFALGTSLVVGLSLSMAQADTLPNSKAAELNLHRIERLVTLKKIDATYQTNFKSLALQALTPVNLGDPSFKVTSLEVAGADGTAKSVDIFLDNTGKEVNHQTAAGSDSLNPPNWPTQDAITLAEDSLHWLEDQGPTVAELTPYFNAMTQLALNPGTDTTGAAIAVVDIQTSAANPILRAWLNLDGTFKSYQLIAR